jgi:SAM-dependent methyltransferase
MKAEAPLNVPKATTSGWNAWLADQERRAGPQLARTRDALLAHAHIRPGDRVLDVGAGRGLIALAVATRVGPGGAVVASDLDIECLATIRALAPSVTAGRRIACVAADAAALPFREASFDAVTARAVLQFLPDRAAAIAYAFRVLRPGGRYSCAEPINRYITPHHQLVDLEPLGDDGRAIAALFAAIYADPNEPMLTFDERDLVALLEDAGFIEVGVNLLVHWERQELTVEQARARVMNRGVAVRPSVWELVSAHLGRDVAERYVQYFAERASRAPLVERRGFAFVWGRKP